MLGVPKIQSMPWPSGGGHGEVVPPLAATAPAPEVTRQNASVRSLKSPIKMTGVPSALRSFIRLISSEVPRSRQRSLLPPLLLLVGLCTLISQTRCPVSLFSSRT